VADSWDKTARDEFAKKQEPITANAANVAKFGAPAAAFVTAVLAAVGGKEIFDVERGETVIAVAIVTAIAVGGAFYVAAHDYRTRGALWVARVETLGRILEYEKTANEETLNAAATKEEAATRKAAEADAKLETLHERERAIEQRESACETKVAAAEKNVADAKAEVKETFEALRRCRERKDPAPAGCTAPPPAYLTLGPVKAVAREKSVTIHAIESVNGTVVRCLVVDAEGRLRWEGAGDVAVLPRATQNPDD